MKPGALIFDLDGTIWDSTSTVTEAWNRVLVGRALRPALTEPEVAATMGLAHLEIFAKLLPGYEAIWEEVAAECYIHETELLLAKGATLYPEAEAGLQKLAEKYPLFLVSNCEMNYLEAFYSVTKFKKFFEDEECFGRTKEPKAKNIANIIARNRLQNPVYIGDTLKDAQSCLAANVPFYQALYGFGAKTESVNHFHSFREMSDFFLAAS